ncbi:hypothetical protein FNV43_RR25651 [Rhamnella rubrinervis]|uniref:NAB domain-containing protein n=1 Tax=Rhamnella rubrinervis TaxID=2594499 RepID=A0A8K0DLH3_9ROSA|nr:hypothetical protein FNV43_RR25651 [Rhamnella rubrinervis]
MEKNKDDQSALSWCWNAHSDRHKSQWLQATLSELDEKIKVIVSIVEEEDGDSFAKRAEMFYERRPQLIHVLQDLQKSYRSLAVKYDQLRLSSTAFTTTQPQPLYSTATTSSSFSPLKSLRQVHSHSIVLNRNQQPDHHHHHDLETLTPVVVSAEEKIGGRGMESDHDGKDDDDDDQVMLELTEDHVRQLNELMRRNNEKRETIKDLCSQINKLMIENQDLNKCLGSRDVTDDQVSKKPKPKPKTTPKQSQLPNTKFKGPSFFGKLTGCSG